MKPWIRRLAMVLGILIPGLIMIYLQVDPLILFSELGLIAIIVLFASGSVTADDFRHLRKSAGTPPVQEPVVAAKKVEPAQAGEKTGTTTSRFRAFSGTLGKLAAVARERWQTWRAGKSQLEAIDRALDTTVPASSARSPSSSPSRPSPDVSRVTSRGPGGDPFEDLLNAKFEPVLLEDEVPGGERKKPETTGVNRAKGDMAPVPVMTPKQEQAGGAKARPGQNGITSGLDSLIPVAAPKPDAETVPPVPAAGPKKETTTVKNPATVKVESVSSPPATGPGSSLPPVTSPQAVTAANGSGGVLPGKGGTTIPAVPGQSLPGGAPATTSATVTVKEIPAKQAGPAAEDASRNPDADILTFGPEAHGTMEDILATLKDDDTRVKRSDDSSLLRQLKGVQVQGKDLEDDLSALLKELE